MKLLTIKQTGIKLGGKSPSTVYRLHKQDPKFPRFVKIGGGTGIIEAELDEYILACREGADEVAA